MPHRPLGGGRPARVHDIELRPVVDALQHMMKEDRMRLPGIAPPEDDDIRLLDLLIGGRPAAHSEDCRQTDDAGGVSGPVAAIDVVAAHRQPGELLRQVVHLVRRFGAAEEAEGLWTLLLDSGPEAGSGPVERLVPAGGPKSAVFTDERGGKPKLTLTHGCPPGAEYSLGAHPPLLHQ